MEMESDSVSIRSSRSGSHAEAVRRTIRYMEGRLDRRVDLDELAAVACMSPCHYLRVFRGLTGIPPARFQCILRLQKAKELLVRTGRSVLDIAQDVGYTSLGTFSSRFAQLVGMAPARFRDACVAMGRGGGVATPNLEPGIPHASSFHGRIERREGDALVFAGLFSSPIPQDVPLSCAILGRDAAFSLAVPDGPGPFHILAVALRQVPPDDMFDNRELIAGVCACGPLRPSDTRIPLQLALRPLDLLDPPILVAFPLLMHMRMSVSATQPVPQAEGRPGFRATQPVLAAARP